MKSIKKNDDNSSSCTPSVSPSRTPKSPASADFLLDKKTASADFLLDKKTATEKKVSRPDFNSPSQKFKFESSKVPNFPVKPFQF